MCVVAISLYSSSQVLFVSHVIVAAFFASASNIHCCCYKELGFFLIPHPLFMLERPTLVCVVIDLPMSIDVSMVDLPDDPQTTWTSQQLHLVALFCCSIHPPCHANHAEA